MPEVERTIAQDEYARSPVTCSVADRLDDDASTDLTPLNITQHKLGRSSRATFQRPNAPVFRIAS